MIVMKEVYLNWHKQLREEIEIISKVKWKKLGRTPRIVVISGMGGSGIVGDYVQVLANRRSDIPVFVTKDFKLPVWISDEDLVITISYSGNTRETIMCYKEALKAKAQVVVISSNGVLEKYAKEDNIPFIPVVKGLVPRASLPSMLTACLYTLEKFGIPLTDRGELEEAIDILRDGICEEEISEVAGKIVNKLPVIVALTDYAPLAWRFKNELNENSKIPVKVEVLPEWAHNDIVGWEKPYNVENYVALLLEPKIHANELELKILDFAKKYFREIGIETIEIPLYGKSLLTQLLYGSLYAGLLSVILARERNLDPLTTISITKYKEYISKHIGV